MGGIAIAQHANRDIEEWLAQNLRRRPRFATPLPFRKACEQRPPPTEDDGMSDRSSDIGIRPC
jgi:hypothetical protein